MHIPGYCEVSSGELGVAWCCCSGLVFPHSYGVGTYLSSRVSIFIYRWNNFFGAKAMVQEPPSGDGYGRYEVGYSSWSQRRRFFTYRLFFLLDVQLMSLCGGQFTVEDFVDIMV